MTFQNAVLLFLLISTITLEWRSRKDFARGYMLAARHIAIVFYRDPDAYRKVQDFIAEAKREKRFDDA